MQKQSEEEWKSTFVENKKKVQDDVSPEELSLVNAILGLGFSLCFFIVDLIEKVEKKEITIPESNRELRHITELFQQLKRQLLSYRAEKWNRVFLASVFQLGPETFTAMGLFFSPKVSKRVYNIKHHFFKLSIFTTRSTYFGKARNGSRFQTSSSSFLFIIDDVLNTCTPHPTQKRDFPICSFLFTQHSSLNTNKRKLSIDYRYLIKSAHSVSSSPPFHTIEKRPKGEFSLVPLRIR